MDYTKLTDKHRVRVQFYGYDEVIEMPLVNDMDGNIHLASGRLVDGSWDYTGRWFEADEFGDFQILEVIDPPTPRAEDMPIGTRLVDGDGYLRAIKAGVGAYSWFLSGYTYTVWRPDKGIQEFIDNLGWRPAPWPAGSVFEVEGAGK